MNDFYMYRKYFTLAELVKFMKDELSMSLTQYSEPLKLFRDYLTKLKTDNLAETYVYACDEFLTIAPATSTIDKSLFAKLLDYNFNDYVDYSEFFGDETEPVFTEEMAVKFLRKFVSLYLDTQEKYKVLLNIYASEKANLLNKVETITTNKFNDTPQNSGDFGSEDYTSNYAITESGTDVEPLINRISQIDNKYRNLMKDWAREFDKLFIVETQLWNIFEFSNQ